jgi:ribosome maturation factor RimP
VTVKQTLPEVIAASVAGLGYELVDVEHSARGLLRVFIDKPDGIGVEDCANVSNQLTRVFTVENIEFDRLEVSSPGLDRALKSVANFQQYQGSAVKVRLNTLVDGRKRFDGVVLAVEGETIIFGIADEASPVTPAKKHKVSGKSKPLVAESQKEIRVPLAAIDKARLIPEF